MYFKTESNFLYKGSKKKMSINKDVASVLIKRVSE